MNTRWIYRALKYHQDYRAMRRAVATGTPAPVVRRLARRAYGKGDRPARPKIVRIAVGKRCQLPAL